MAEAICFARRQGYGTLASWTNEALISARRIYKASGFTLVKKEMRQCFGHELVGQY